MLVQCSAAAYTYCIDNDDDEVVIQDAPNTATENQQILIIN
ncbi:MAG: hypothetical protein WB443_12895 [Nitrososphaeraceae archaeon]